MILTQDLCQLQDNSMLTALTRQQVTLRVDIARVMAAAATRSYALKRGNRVFFLYQSQPFAFLYALTNSLANVSGIMRSMA